MLNKLYKNCFALYLPLFVFYAFYIIKYRYPALWGDEPRYLGFAANLLHGFYSPPAPDINLWNGPGYPMMLMPFVALHTSMVCISLLNAAFMYLAVVFLHKALAFFVKPRFALLFGLLLGLNFTLWHHLTAIYTEAFTIFLMAAFVYTLVFNYQSRKKSCLVISGIIFGFLTLTKVIFGYVLLVCLLVCVLILAFKRVRKHAREAVLILIMAFVVTAPYLLYTYHITHKIFYWGNAGGMSLYWMSTPYDNEYGDWKEENLKNSTFPLQFRTAEGDSLLRLNHIKDITEVKKYHDVARDSAYKALAVKNIEAKPKKFAWNYLYNCSRMLFDFPYSYYYHASQGIGNILWGSFYLWAMIVGVVISAANYRRLIYPLKFMLLLVTVYLILSGTLSAYPRQFDVVEPVILFWLAYLAGNLLPLSVNFKRIN
jgi:4-amino-4-deoxy-L-arabinose transferase-like glycosyltransferase